MPYLSIEDKRRYQREWVAKRRQEWINENGPCSNCGSTELLEVDHKDSRHKISHRIWSWSKQRREAELLKCQVLCRMCHIVKTAINKDRPGIKLSTNDVAAIRRRHQTDGTIRGLAREYGVDPQTIRAIVRKRSWKHQLSR